MLLLLLKINNMNCANKASAWICEMNRTVLFFSFFTLPAVKFAGFFSMCISPVRIPNPNRGSNGPNSQYKDTKSLYINVPCGVCPECVASRQMQIVQRLQVESLVNHLFFCTLTYNNESMPVVSTSTGYDIRYADVCDVQNMFKRLRKRKAFGRPFRYFAVSELGTSRGRPH